MTDERATTPEDQRREPPNAGDERATLCGFLNFQRATLVWKCDGLTDAQLRLASVPTSNLTALGLVRHLAEVERSWARKGVEELRDTPYVYCAPDNQDGDFDDVATADVGTAWSDWRAECAHFDEVTAARELADTFATRSDGEISIRWLYAHMIEEYARHNGHLDLIREAIDGATGE